MSAPMILAKEVRTVDNKGRFVLGSSKSGEQYQQSEAADGTITLTPVAVIPKRELWLYQNSEAMASLDRGIADAAAGRVKRLGSFARYATDDAADEE